MAIDELRLGHVVEQEGEKSIAFRPRKTNDLCRIGSIDKEAEAP